MLSDLLLGQLRRDTAYEDLSHSFLGRGFLGLNLAVAQGVVLLRQNLVHRGGFLEENEPEPFGPTNLVLLDGVFFDGSILGEIFAEFIFLGLPTSSHSNTLQKRIISFSIALLLLE